MIFESRQTIYKGISFSFTSFAGLDKRGTIKFQSAILERGLEYSATHEGENFFRMVREKPNPLEIQIALPGAPAIAQLSITGAHGAHHGDLFEHEAEAVVRAFNDVWHAKGRQILTCEASVRDLFESSYEHAFQELWVHRLRQPEEALSILGRPVLGGGIRLVMPPMPDEVDPCQIEVKIESFLRDTKKIFVETQFVWPQATDGDKPLDPAVRMQAIDEYVDEKVISFMAGENEQ